MGQNSKIRELHCIYHDYTSNGSRMSKCTLVLIPNCSVRRCYILLEGPAYFKTLLGHGSIIIVSIIIRIIVIIIGTYSSKKENSSIYCSSSRVVHVVR